MPGMSESRNSRAGRGRACATEGDLRALLREELPAERRQWLEGHLAECRACVDHLGRLAAEEEGPWDFSPETVPVGQDSREMLAVVAQALPGGAHEIPPSTQLGANEPADCPPQISGFADLVEVGRGATGIVYRGLDIELQRPVAIKVL